jgi:hypothetical protein
LKHISFRFFASLERGSTFFSLSLAIQRRQLVTGKSVRKNRRTFYSGCTDKGYRGKEKRQSNQELPLILFCARDWNRTSTFLRTADFESAASTNSATRAGGFKGCNVTTFCSIVKNLVLNKFQIIYSNSF